MKKSRIVLLCIVFCFLCACGAKQTANEAVVPTAEPTATPTAEPTATPIVEPTATPTVEPTTTPTAEPTATPTAEPTATPTVEPTATPTVEPTVTPTPEPTATPTAEPTATPTPEPTVTPTPEPTATPTPEPTATPTPEPTATPTPEPTATPTPEPTATPTPEPTATPTPEPTATPTPTPDVNRVVHEVSVYPGASAREIQMMLDMALYGGYDELVVKLPKGTYYLDGTLYVYSNTTIKAEQGAKFYKNRVYGAVIEGGITYDRGGYENCKNVTIDGGLWDAKSIMNQTGGTETFRFIHASDITIKNAELSNLPEESHFIVLAGVKDAVIENCSFHGYGDNGDSKREPKEAVQLDVAHSAEIVPTNQNILWDDLPCKNVVIRDCEFYDYSRAIGSHTAVAGVYHEGIVIQNNTIRDMEEVAIKMYQYKDSVVSGNEISNCAGGIVLYTELGNSKKDAYFKPLNGKAKAEPKNLNVVLENNSFTDITVASNNVYGDAIRLSATESLPMNGITVRNNVISDTLRYGVFATTVSGLEISENKIKKTEGYGIILEQNSQNADICFNQIDNTGSCGIWVASGSTGALIQGNKVSKYAQKEERKYGIAVYQAGDKNNKTVIKGNEVTNPGTATELNGIHINGSDYVELAENKVYDVAGCGIYIYMSKYCSVMKNEVNGTVKNGIYVTTECDGTTITKNTVNGAGDISIMTYQAPDSVVTDNEVNTVSSLAGIRISQSNGSLITGNHVTGAYKKREVWVTGSENCTSKDNVIN